MPHGAAVGWSVVTVAGAVCLAAGLVSLLGGAVTTIRAVPTWWGRLLAIPAVILTAYAAVFVLALAVVATNVPATALGGTDPAGAGLPFRDVSLTTSDGVQLSGCYIPGSSGAAVALLHGSGSTRSDVLPQAQVLARTVSEFCCSMPAATAAAPGGRWTSAGTAIRTSPPRWTTWRPDRK